MRREVHINDLPPRARKAVLDASFPDQTARVDSRPVSGATGGYERSPEPRHFIGIDPGRKTGLAVWDAKLSTFELLDTLDFWQTVDLVTTAYPPLSTVLVIEDPGMNKPTFGHGEAARRKREKISRNVGWNQCEAALLIEGFERLGYEVRRVRPQGKKGEKRKWNAAKFRAITGYTKRTSEHSRDAGMLVYNFSR